MAKQKQTVEDLLKAKDYTGLYTGVTDKIAALEKDKKTPVVSKTNGLFRLSKTDREINIATTTDAELLDNLYILVSNWGLAEWLGYPTADWKSDIDKWRNKLKIPEQIGKYKKLADFALSKMDEDAKAEIEFTDVLKHDL